MAKDLKLKVKNTQLAEALKLRKEKKEEAAAPKKAVIEKASTFKKKAEQMPPEAIPPSVSPKENKKLASKKAVEAPSAAPVSIPPKIEGEKKLKTEEKETSLKASLKKEKSPAEKEKEEKALVSEASKKREKPPALQKEEDFAFGRGMKDLKGKGFGVKEKLKQEQGDEDRPWRRRKPKAKFAQAKAVPIVRPNKLSVRLPISVKDLAQAMKLKASELIAKLFMQGITITINDYLDDETTVQLLGHDFECEISIDTSEEQRLKITEKSIQEEIKETSSEKLIHRSPIIAFMGHVDHGKTSLIDAIRKSNIAGGEAGAITQHIGAFKCHRQQGDVTILDTPGHEAFSLMRKRGVTVTDIVILVIAGDEGIRMQTDEAIKHAKEAGVPIIVAINKCDKPNFNVENVYRELADRELLPEAWGGSTITVSCSATTKKGITELLEMVLLQAEMLELKANPTMRARGTIIESELHKGFGPVATILVQNGTLHLGDALVIDQIYARVKTMHDEHGKVLEIAGPSTPVKITGLSGVPTAGVEVVAVKNENEARKLCEERTSGEKRILIRGKGESIEGKIQRQQELSEKKLLSLILRADVQGSLEAVKSSLRAIPTKKVELLFISEGVGEISESDIELALASEAPIIGFHTNIERHAESIIKQTKVVIKNRNIIYHLIDDVKELMIATLDKIRQENEMGSALVKQTFKVSGLGTIAGCTVTDGMLRRDHLAKVYRDGKIIWEGKIGSLKRVKEDAREVVKGQECGILLEKFKEVQEGDLIKTFEISYLTQEL
ncbi:MAG: translation initiation factor IF-2 [Simkania negevensis]|nr:translation initiation factor IF-2 [Simkania negevensis]